MVQAVKTFFFTPSLIKMAVRGCSHIMSAVRGGGGVSQKMTIADEGGRGGKPKDDDC